jgi:hypothetical protein
VLRWIVVDVVGLDGHVELLSGLNARHLKGRDEHARGGIRRSCGGGGSC